MAVLLFYMVMVGLTPSVVRACIMQIFLLAAPRLRRESDGLTSLSAALLVILLANGARKAEIVSKAITGPVTNEVPASILQKHPNCIWLLDQDAAGLLPRELVEMKNP